MEAWELFFKGFTKTIEEFASKMIEKGREDTGSPGEKSSFSRSADLRTPASEPESGTPKRVYRKRTIKRRDLGELEGKIVEAIRQFPTGCTLKDIAKVLNMQWHYLRIPLRQLVLEEKLIKDGKIYTISNETGETVETIPEPEPVEETVPAKGKRRVVDAKILDEKKAKRAEKSGAAVMNSREKEILRFKVQTAFRGRPEGLTLAELAAVLGRSVDGLDTIIDELIKENKVVGNEFGKFCLE